MSSPLLSSPRKRGSSGVKPLDDTPLDPRVRGDDKLDVTPLDPRLPADETPLGPRFRGDDDVTLFQMRGVSKRYGGVRALQGADLAINAGRIHAVLGENGAGKSTLIKIMTGVVAPD